MNSPTCLQSVEEICRWHNPERNTRMVPCETETTSYLHNRMQISWRNRLESVKKEGIGWRCRFLSTKDQQNLEEWQTHNMTSLQIISSIDESATGHGISFHHHHFHPTFLVLYSFPVQVALKQDFLFTTAPCNHLLPLYPPFPLKTT